jgi:hypothetical protein
MFPVAEIHKMDIAHLNLLCAESLTTNGSTDNQASLNTLDTWADRVKDQTARHSYRFERSPHEFEDSPGFFKMIMLAVVLSEDFGVHYDSRRIVRPEASSETDGFYDDPALVFLPGLLGPNHEGTCSSIPVLYVAIGRRLGYPLKLVTTKGHLFVRWDGKEEHFNIEATGKGINRFDDEYYRHWPFELSREAAAAEGYLKSLTPPEELAAFLAIRGLCLNAKNKPAEAQAAFAAAARLAPNCRSYGVMRDRFAEQKSGAVQTEL